MLTLLLTLALIGVVAWGITTYIPMPQPVKNVIVVVAVVGCILAALHAFGVALPILH